MFSNDLIFLWPFQRPPTSIVRAARLALVALLVLAPLGWQFACEWAQRNWRGPATSLAEAVIDHDAPRVRQLLAQGADPSVEVDKGFTPLMVAALTDDCEVVQALLNGGADPNQRTRSRENALSLAAWSGDERVVALLLSRGASANLRAGESGYRNPPLVAAARSGTASVEVMQLLIDAGAELNACDDEGMSASVAAISGGRDDLARVLARATARQQWLAKGQAAFSSQTVQ